MLGIAIVTILSTVVAHFEPQYLAALRRDPGALGSGQLWRLLSPVLVQPDPPLRAAAVLALVAGLSATAERLLGFRRALALYLVGALVGHGMGELWDPNGAGCSVAACGVLGGLCVWMLRARAVQIKIGAACWLIFGAVGCWLRDIHGPAIIAGALLGIPLLRAVPLTRALTGDVMRSG
jgi:rhomboid protease GluP